MSIKDFKSSGSWRDIADAARTTVGKEKGDPQKEIPISWKRRILLAEHSPIRKLRFSWTWERLKSWVSVHFVRHCVGILHFVTTSRTDRTGINRDVLPQDNPVNHECEANVQALINVSRRRLCKTASKETQEAWKEVVEMIKKEDFAVGSVLVPDCIYRGYCYSMEPCGWFKTEEGQKQLQNYRSL